MFALMYIKFMENSYCVVCGAPCLLNRKTCSQRCHEIYMAKMEREFGKYKKVVDVVTGKTHKVSIRYILEHGLKWSELKDFPEWEE